MGTPTTKGNCYLCGKTLAKSGFRRHFAAAHTYDGPNAQKCVLLKVEDTYDKDYWLFLDLPVTSSLKTLDSFLRRIWLECCGHLSAFYLPGYRDLPMNVRVGDFAPNLKIQYEYDFGSTTYLTITVLDTVYRPKQRTAVRLLARNVPIHFACGKCGKEAEYICCECMFGDQNPFFCENCLKKHEHKDNLALPVTNSPRMGVCGYEGEFDIYEFHAPEPDDT